MVKKILLVIIIISLIRIAFALLYDNSLFNEELRKINGKITNMVISNDNTIIDIDRKGALIKLDNGIIVNTNPVTLGNYNTNPIKKTMIINDTGYKMKLATSVLVRISSVDISNKKIYVDITKVIVKEKEQVSKKVRKI